MVLCRDGPAGGLIWCEMSWRLTPFSPIYHAISLLISNHSCHYDIYYALWSMLCIMIYSCHYDIYYALWYILCIMILAYTFFHTVHDCCIYIMPYWYILHFNLLPYYAIPVEYIFGIFVLIFLQCRPALRLVARCLW